MYASDTISEAVNEDRDVKDSRQWTGHVVWKGSWVAKCDAKRA